MDREECLRGYLNNFRGVREREFVKDYLQSMNPDDPDIFLPDNPKEYIPIRNKAFDQTLGSGFAEAYDKYKVLGSGAFGTTFQDPDDPNKVFKAQRLMMKDDINRAEKEKFYIRVYIMETGAPAPENNSNQQSGKTENLISLW